jgi:hypothetical protein
VGYRLKPGRPIDSEVRRIAGRQLQRALTEMRRVGGSRSDRTVHEARRRVKKVRALIHLVQPELGSGYGATNRRLRTVIRLLGPIADGESVVGTLSELATRYHGSMSSQAVASIRAGLVRRERRVDRKAAIDRVLPTAAELVRTALERLPRWTLQADGFRAITGGLEKTVRGARRAMARAEVGPGNDTFLRWRHRVKDHWFQIRLIEERTAHAFQTTEEQLETLDGILGAHHNCALLEDILQSDALASRTETAACLRVLRRHQSKLRAEALTLGAEIYRQKPSRFIKNVRRQWRLAGRMRAREVGDRRVA